MSGALQPTITYASPPPPGITITSSSIVSGTVRLNWTPSPFLFAGVQLGAINERLSTGNLTISFDAAVLQSFFSQVVFTNNIFGQLTYTTASADSFSSGGVSIWTWNAQVFNSGNVGGTAVFS